MKAAAWGMFPILGPADLDRTRAIHSLNFPQTSLSVIAIAVLRE
jgi:hypothetical protein